MRHTLHSVPSSTSVAHPSPVHVRWLHRGWILSTWQNDIFGVACNILGMPVKASTLPVGKVRIYYCEAVCNANLKPSAGQAHKLCFKCVGRQKGRGGGDVTVTNKQQTKVVTSDLYFLNSGPALLWTLSTLFGQVKTDSYPCNISTERVSWWC